MGLQDFFNKNYKVLCVLGIGFFLLLHLNGVTYGMNVLFLITLFGALVVKDSKNFLKDWLPIMALFYVYEISRAHAYEVAKLFWSNPITTEVIWLESQFFFFMGDLPTIFLQRTLNPVLASPDFIDYTLFPFYAVFFWGWALTGFVIWLYKREYFHKYFYGLLTFSMFCVVIFTLAPTAPPWYASEIGLIDPVDRVLWQFEYIPGMEVESVQSYGKNDFAAVPSLHTAWAVFAVLYLVKAFGKKYMFFFIFPLGIAFATWYGAEHYVVDSLIGAAMAYMAFYISLNYKAISEKLKYLYTLKTTQD